MHSRAPLWAALATFVLVVAVVGSVVRARDDGSPGGGRDQVAAGADLSAQVVQLRRDEVLGRVEVALTNGGADQVVVEAVRLRTGGFTGGGWVPKDSPVPAGQLVDLPTPYGDPRCPATAAPTVGPLAVDVRFHTDRDPASREVTLTPTQSRALLRRVLTSLCTAHRLAAQVQLALGPAWRTEGTGGPARIRLHTTLQARLAPGAPDTDISQLAGTVIYDLRADGGRPPYARLTAAHPVAEVPVVLAQARCSGHAMGETKQPYRFLVWVGPPGTGGTAVELPTTDDDHTRLRALCAF